MGCHRRRATRELEPVRDRLAAAWVGVEGLRTQHGQGALDARAPRGRQLVLGDVAHHQARHSSEIEGLGVQDAKPGAQCLGLLAGHRMRMRGAQDVVELAHQPIDLRSRRRAALHLNLAPGALDQACGQGGVAIGDLPVMAQAIGRAQQQVEGLRVARRSALGRQRPQLPQSACSPFGHEGAQGLLLSQQLPAHALALDAARRERGDEVGHHGR